MTFQQAMETVVSLFEVIGVAILGLGSVLALSRGVIRLWHGQRRAAYDTVRQELGRVILLGIEILIVADIVQTVTVSQTLESALTLGIIVLVRTFLSFSLDIELDGVVPWRRGRPPASPANPDGSSLA